ncbi:MAG: glycoside hydrolase family 16 protein [Bacteroidaceae bacterium]|nr:glycoside hydrolase family 16 protein [Bacteroidaceae bacterium]
MNQFLRKHICSLLVCLLLPLLAFAQENYPIAFDRDADRTRMDRILNGIVLNGNVFQVASPMKMYHDLSNHTFRAHAGDLISPSLAFTGKWMDSYIYIDKDRNGAFDVVTPGTAGALTEDNELVSFSGLSLPDGAFNSYGEPTDLSQVQPPSFVLPEDMEPGIYMMRVKIDWDDANPAGRMDEANGIIRNGGAVLDIHLEILPDGEYPEGCYAMTFNDEFDGTDGSQPDNAKWRRSNRYGSTWNRFISNSEDVVFLREGHLVCRAIPNPDPSSDPVPMLTGSVETRDNFSFTYGWVEARLKTTPHVGNFPAFWMMPQPPTDTWPKGGEIDIFEAIDAQNTAFHTLHSHWTSTLGNKNNPKSSFSESVTQGEWHVFAANWTEDAIAFYVDGNPVGTYAKSQNASDIEQGQWPFQHDFYLILNQSVGDGSWAKAPDTAFTYETLFDWVRVFQKDAVPTSIKSLPDTRLTNDWYTLDGRKLQAEPTSPGIYIHAQRKVAIK